MKMKKLLFIILLSLGFGVNAQTQTKNYVKTIVPVVETTSLETNVGKETAQVDIVYFDGLGRQEQTVSKEASPDGYDMINVVTYDGFGRQDKSYLPYEMSNATSGAYRTDWSTEINTFYNSSSNTTVDESTYYYSQPVYEASPLNRVLKQMAPGADWVGADRGVTMDYDANAASDNIFGFIVANSGVVSVIEGTYYGAGKLYKNTTTDEDGNKVVEFTNISGQTICKKAYLTSTSSADTYYLYDDFGQLRYVIQPEGVIQMGSDWNMINDLGFRDQWVFQYQYDARKRMIVKKVPGAQPVYMVYDKRDRLVLTQDGNQRGNQVKAIDSEYEAEQYEWTDYDITSSSSVTLKPGFSFVASDHQSFYAGENASAEAGEWLFTKYDALNRPVMTGIISSSLSREELQEVVNAIADYDVDYVGRATGNIYGYDNTGYPAGISSSDVLTVTFYDNYEVVTDHYWGTGYQVSTYNDRVTGQVTAGYTRVLGGGMLKSVTYYDDRYRPIAVISENHLSGKDHISNEFFNNVLPYVKKTKRTHTTAYASDSIVEAYTYDHRGRLLETATSIDNGDPSTIKMDYNNIGELISKDLNGLQSVDYAYNIRGWLTTINGGTSFDDANDKFGMELKYASGTNKYYNGNIGEITWKALDNYSSNIDVAQTYDFHYDGLNRLKRADYNSEGSYDFFKVTGNNSGIQYDANGNILSLHRYYKDELGDKLVYTYSGNQLQGVVDQSTSAEKDFGFVDDAANSNDDYRYDANGNMIYDGNKGITNISYNYLNLPESVTTPNGTIEYLYDAAGMKLSVIETSGKIRDYISEIHYEKEPSESSPQLAFIQHAEGRAVYDGTNFAYQYNLTDHLGNVRAVVSDELLIKDVIVFNDQNNVYILDTETESYLDIPIFESISSGSKVSVSFDVTVIENAYVVIQLQGAGLNEQYVIEGDEAFETVSFSGKATTIGAVELSIFDVGGTGSVEVSNINAKVIPRGNVIQRDDYYPFGLTFNSVTPSNENLYKFNGNECSDELGAGFWDFNARTFDSNIGRFLNVDPLSTEQLNQSTYQYSWNNSVNRSDASGMMPCKSCGGIVDIIYLDGNSELGQEEFLATTKVGLYTWFHGNKDEKSKALSTIKNTFKMEFGLKTDYSFKTNMFTYLGDFASELSQSPSATRDLKELLTTQNVFKFHVGYEISGVTSFEFGQSFGSNSWIDLADFNLDGTLKGFKYDNVESRAYNLARIIEHELLGHSYMSIGGMSETNIYATGRVVDRVNTFRRERNLQERLNYGDSRVLFGDTSNFKNKRAMKKFVRQVITEKLNHPSLVR